MLPCCGDGVVTPPEECDDGGTENGDGCNALCVKESAVSMTWTDNGTGWCSNAVHQTFKQIAAAMPSGPVNVTITAKQLQPAPNYGDWSATFHNTSCVKLWLQTIGDKNVSQYNNWNPAVCQATDTAGDAYYFVCKSDGGGSPQIAIYPVGVQPALYMKIYMLDRTGAWCDLAGVNNRPGFNVEVTNSNSSGVAGDSVTFTWWK